MEVRIRVERAADEGEDEDRFWFWTWISILREARSWEGSAGLTSMSKSVMVERAMLKQPVWKTLKEKN